MKEKSKTTSITSATRSETEKGGGETEKTKAAASASSLTYGKVASLPILSNLSREIQRVYPALAGVSRGPNEATRHNAQQLAGYKIPKKWIVWSCNYVCNRDASRFKNPNKFDITRWDEEREKQTGEKHDSKDSNSKHKGFGVTSSELAFGSGPRKCPGAHLAMAMWKGFMATMLRDYAWRIEPQGGDGSEGTKDGDDGWLVKWIPVYRPVPDVKVRFGLVPRKNKKKKKLEKKKS
mmetsp:Transcript_23419/g.45663  ORF Transcript_23419/g.45663 Transcript_23419/m.45663 type:complete len:236 (+) Transcript_23419:1052-1759(+)